MRHLKLYESFQIDEATSAVKIADKDWDRMLALVMADKDGEAVAKAIRDKNKAIARFVSGVKLAGGSLKYDDRWKQYSGYFSEFGDKAISLGATPEEIQEIFDNTEVPAKYSDKMDKLGSKKLNNRFVGTLSKSILDAGFDIEYMKNNGNALTHDGRDAMDRNGRKWTIGYVCVIDLGNGKTADLAFDAITDEGDGPTSYVVNTDGGMSDPMFRSMYGRMGKVKFVSTIIDKLKSNR